LTKKKLEQTAQLPTWKRRKQKSAVPSLISAESQIQEREELSTRREAKKNAGILLRAVVQCSDKRSSMLSNCCALFDLN